MSHVLAESQKELDDIRILLAKNLPSYRQAYSDRTCWIMACLSELAYLRFNPLFSKEQQKEYFLESIEKLIGKKRKNALVKLIDLVAYDPDAKRKQLKEDLGLLNMQLEETFDNDGTQAILVSTDKYLVLSFRGTEAKSIKDIKADARAKLVACDSGGKVHFGFKHAYGKVGLKIQDEINLTKYSGKPLFITGHSLGGALATIAAKKLSHEAGIAACYTFGSPRVGNEDWIWGIKTSLYRLVNAADCVTMLPPGSDMVTIFSWLAQFIPYVGLGVRKYLQSNVGGYMHGGDMRYLTNCRQGEFQNVRLLYSVTLFRRIKGLIIRSLPWKHFLADHSIKVYRKKLEVIAHVRNP